LAGSTRDYLNATIDSWFAIYNVGYTALVTAEDGLDVTARIRTNVASQSLVLTRTLDYLGAHARPVDRAAVPLRGIELRLRLARRSTVFPISVSFGRSTFLADLL
jgi:hypothetical protein